MARVTNTTRYARFKSYAQNSIYHIYNRGNGKQDIFLDENDYRYYFKLLTTYLNKHNVTLICYILMPNHIHLVVKQETKTPIYKFISSLHTSYSMYFNKKYNHVGHLFQDRFKQVVVETDEQLLHLTCYIHLNPVSAGIVKKPEDYIWSSYAEYLGTSPFLLCKKEIIMGLLNANNETFPAKYEAFCTQPIDEKKTYLIEEIAIETF